MLSDEQRAALETAQRDRRMYEPLSRTDRDSIIFAAGIAYAQTQQAAMIAQARAEERKVCELLAMCEAIRHRTNSHGAIVGYAIAAAIRARKDSTT